MRDRRLRQVLDRDILLEFEEKTGHSYKESAHQQAALGYLLVESQRREAAVRASGDTVWCHPFEDYVAKVLALGFRVVRKVICWTAPVGGHRRVQKPAYELWHDTYGVLFTLSATERWPAGWDVNEADIFFNLRPRDAHGPRGCSGQWQKDAAGAWLYVGGKDMRVGLCFEWQELLDAGTFVTPWVKYPYMARCARTVRYAGHWHDPGDRQRYQRIRDHRIATLPPEILAAMGWKPEASA